MRSYSPGLAGVVLGIVWGMASSLGQGVQAQTTDEFSAADGAPEPLIQNLQALDQAASQEDLTTLLQYYSPDFVHGDGLTRSSLESALEEFWHRYSDLNYATELLSWEQTAQGLVVDIQTQIQGTEVLEKRDLALEVTLNSRQYWQNDQIVRLEVLREYSQIQTGDSPPTLDVSLPAEIGVNQSFHFDVVVQEPLEGDLVLGAVLDEPVRQNRFFDLTELEVEPLAAGGLFKVGRAPAVRDDRWISAVIIRKGGITWVTQRLRILDSSDI